MPSLTLPIARPFITAVISSPANLRPILCHLPSASVAFPIFKKALLNLGWFYVAFGALVIMGSSNAVNFTDGLDGLATVPVMIAAGTFGLIAYLVGNAKFADYLQLHAVQGVGEVGVYCAAMVGSCLGFLWYNAPPAKIFVNDCPPPHGTCIRDYGHVSRQGPKSSDAAGRGGSERQPDHHYTLRQLSPRGGLGPTNGRLYYSAKHWR